ncbi:MAG: chromate transporter [Bacillota bacterium]
MGNKKSSEFLEIFITFFKIGAFTIGGGYAMLPLIEKEVVENKKWVKPEEIIDIFAIVQSVPGVIAINSSIFIGYKRAKIKGAVAAALGVILPSFIIILLISQLLLNISENVYIEKAFAGVRAGVTALILLTAIKLTRNTIKGTIPVIIAVLSFIAIAFFNVHIILIIIAGGITGYLIFGIRKVSRL